jgi:hypothetical protein
VGQDQKDIWTSPFKARIQDLNWIIPLTGLTVGLINADAEIPSRISGTGTFSVHANTLSNAGVGILVGGSGGLYLLGKFKSKATFLHLTSPSHFTPVPPNRIRQSWCSAASVAQKLQSQRAVPQHCRTYRPLRQ